MLIKFLLHGKEIDLTGDNVIIKSNNFNVDKDGNMTCNNANFSSASIKNGNFEIDSDGNMNCKNANITGGKVNISGNGASTDLIRVSNNDNISEFSYLQPTGAGFAGTRGRIDVYAQGNNFDHSGIDIEDNQGSSIIRGSGITTPSLTQTSLKESKKNFEKLEKGIDIVNNTEIYKYHLKSQNDKEKKHIGFVIGKNYKYANEITAVDKDGQEVGVDTYSMISVAYKAIQELTKEIEDLKRRLEEN